MDTIIAMRRWAPIRWLPRIWGGSITAAELIEYGSADGQVQDDVSAVGGAIDALMRPVFTQFASNAKLALISDGTDVRLVDVTGRDATGALVTETITLTNAVEVLSTNTYERILIVKAQTTSGSRTVTAKQGSGGSTIGTIPISEKGFYAMFIQAFSTTSQQIRYEKTFWKNTDGTLTLTSSTLTLTADPSTVTQIGGETSVNGSQAVGNRLTVPSGPTFVGVGTAQNVPGGGNLAAGAAIGMWVQQTLGINNAPIRSTFTSQLAGNTV